MYEYQADSLTEEIQQKIKYFTKEKYFNLFSYMLTKKTKNFSAFKKVSSLVLSIDNLIKEKEMKQKKKLNITKIEEKKPRISPWFYFMMHICNVPHKKKYIKQKKNELNIDPIIYTYMANFCHNKVRLLTHFSIHHKLNLETLVKYYLDLCSDQITLEKEKLKEKENQSKINEEKNIINNREIYNRRKSKSKLNNNFSSSEKIIRLNIKSQKSLQISPKKSKAKINTLFDKKSKKDGKQIDYSHSFARLFIGETDQKSIKERYLSDIVIKKVKELHIFNKNEDLSSLYLKRLYRRSFKNDNGLDNEMNILLNKFKVDSKMVENYQRNALSFDNKSDEEKNMDEDKENHQSQIQKQLPVYSKPFLDSPKFSKNKKLSKYSLGSPFSESENKILMKLRNSRNKLNINIKGDKHKSLLFNLSSDYDKGFSSNFSRNGKKSLNSFRMSMTNNSKSKTTINSRLSKYNVKINLKYSPVSKLKLKTRKSSINKDNDIFINIRTKLNKENGIFNINKRRLDFKYNLDDDLFNNKYK